MTVAYFTEETAPNDEGRTPHFVPGHRYPVRRLVRTVPGFEHLGRSFYIVTPEGDEWFCLEHGCAHLGDGSWIIEEVDDAG